MKAIEHLEIYEKEMNSDIELFEIWFHLANNFDELGN